MVDVHKQVRDVDADLQTHPYDLSERHLFTLKAGQLDPVASWQVVPGDYFEIDPVAFMRTQKVNTAAFARMRFHLDFFFVPYWQLWHQFPQMKYQRQDPTSANQYNNFGKMSPFLPLSSVYAQCLRYGASTNQNPGPNAYEDYAMDTFGYTLVGNSCRLCDMLGYGSLRNMFKITHASGVSDYATIAAIPSQYQSKNVNIWPWLAYQKIWNDFYRNPIYDIAIDPRTFNVDDCVAKDAATANIALVRGGSSANTLQYIQALEPIFELHYRQWKNDYFTGLFPDKQFGDVSQVVGSSSLKLGPVAGTSTASISILGTASNLPGTVYAASNANGWSSNILNVTSGISAIDLRRAELLQIWKEKTMRAGYHTNDQQKAHFGVSSEYMPDEHVRHLGGSSSLLDINEVVSTSLNNTGLSGVSSTDGLGELGGKGTSLLNGTKIRFHVKDDGIIMAIASVLPESSYNSYGLQHCHTRIDPFDYFTPAFQNLGFEAVTRCELNLMDEIQTASDITETIGFAPPYYDLKMGVDKVHGEFISEDLPQQNSTPWLVVNQNRGSLSYFDSARRDAAGRVGTLPFFYVDPHVLDSVFAVNADSSEATDQFWVAAYFNVKAVRPISVLGLPNF